MKKAVFLLTCLAVSLVFIVNAGAATYVVHKAGQEPCMGGDARIEHKSANDLYCSTIFYLKGTEECDSGFHEFLDEVASETYCQ